MTIEATRDAVMSAKTLYLAFPHEVSADGTVLSTGFIPVAKKFILRELRHLNPGSLTTARHGLVDGQVIFDERPYSGLDGKELPSHLP